MKIHIDVVTSLPDAELPLPGSDIHNFAVLKDVLREPKIGIFEMWRMKRFIEKSYVMLNDKKRLKNIKKDTAELKAKNKQYAKGKKGSKK